MSENSTQHPGVVQLFWTGSNWVFYVGTMIAQFGGAMSRQSVSGFWLVVKPGHVSKHTCLEENWNMKILDDFKIKGNMYFDHTEDIGIGESMTLSLIA